MNDADFVRRVRSGDTDAYAHLVEHYRNAIYGLAYHRLQNFEDARDVAQEAFIQAYLRLHQLQDPAKFGAWLRQIASNECRMWQRRQHPAESLEALPPGANHSAQVETKMAVQQMLACLSGESRLTLTLFYLQSYSLQEIADFLEVPVTTIKSRLRNARTKLRKELWDMLEDTIKPAPLPQDFATRIMQLIDGGTVWALAFAPDGKTLASGSSDQTVKLWDTQSGSWLRTLTGHQRPVDTVAFAPDGKTLASGSRDRTVKLWDTRTGELIRTLNNQGRADALAFAPDSQMLVTLSDTIDEQESFNIIDSKVLVWDCATGELLHELEALRRVEALNDLAPRDNNAGGMFYSVVFSPDGQTIVTGNGVTQGSAITGGEVKLWHGRTGRLLRVLEVPEFCVQPVAVSPDGQIVAAGCTRPATVDRALSAEVRFWCLATGELQGTIKEDDGWFLKSLSFAPDGNLVAVGRMQVEGGNSVRCDLRLWHIQSGALLQTLSDGRTGRSVIAFSPAGTLLASGGPRHDINLLRVQ